MLQSMTSQTSHNTLAREIFDSDVKIKRLFSVAVFSSARFGAQEVALSVRLWVRLCICVCVTFMNSSLNFHVFGSELESVLKLSSSSLQALFKLSSSSLQALFKLSSSSLQALFKLSTIKLSSSSL